MTHLLDRRFDVRNHWRQGKHGAIRQGLCDAFFDVQYEVLLPVMLIIVRMARSTSASPG
jgi:hypothetical protein